MKKVTVFKLLLKVLFMISCYSDELLYLTNQTIIKVFNTLSGILQSSKRKIPILKKNLNNFKSMTLFTIAFVMYGNDHMSEYPRSVSSIPRFRSTRVTRHSVYGVHKLLTLENYLAGASRLYGISHLPLMKSGRHSTRRYYCCGPQAVPGRITKFTILWVAVATYIVNCDPL